MFNDIYKNKKIFITGGTGFKGSWCIKWLLKLGAIVKNYSLPPEDISHFNNLNLNNTIENDYSDIRNIISLRESIENFQPDLIIHMAAQALVLSSWENPLQTHETNIQGTVNLLDVCKNIKSIKSIKGIVCIVTDKIYENSEDFYPKREIDRLGSNDPYSTSKACVELIAESYRQLYDSKIITTCRAGNTIGGGDWSKYRIIPDYVRAIINKKDFILRNPFSVRPYIYILDVLDGYLSTGEQILKRNMKMNEAYNFGPDNKNEISGKILLDLMRKYYLYDNILINAKFGKKLESDYLTLDSTKAWKILNWKPKYDIEQSVEKTMNWYIGWNEYGEAITEEQIDDYMENF